MSDMFHEWYQRIQFELNAAEQARAAGNEGRARVNARRAAGWAVGVFQMITSGVDQVHPSALALLQWYIEREETPEPLREQARRLTVHVTENHALPHPEDPLQDAKDLVRELLGDRGFPLESS